MFWQKICFDIERMTKKTWMLFEKGSDQSKKAYNWVY